HMEKLRAAMPDIALRTTFIVGYPGETEAEFQGLLDFVEEIEFDKVGAFPFSPEPGTPAALLSEPVPDAVKEERFARLMELQQPISLRRNQAQVGKKLSILVEGEGEMVAEDGRGQSTPLLMGRSYRDAPEVDGLVLVPGMRGVPAGEFMEVHINGAMEYDLVGEPLLATTFSSRRVG
ncbi:MAG: tRNA (N6-isopentenyl adenosine(37)-C2)-methylthiotransferase MiaB, partial [Caldilineaceae bacterium]|nr:tRNA (N6-isopentenyl adenosine(37)-C2)-methylthiotransferase MiaB [Caldilineaceae bacterium]